MFWGGVEWVEHFFSVLISLFSAFILGRVGVRGVFLRHSIFSFFEFVCDVAAISDKHGSF